MELVKVRNLHIGLIFFFFSVCAWGQEKDLFEQIALQDRKEVVGLEENPQPQYPDILLPWYERACAPFKLSEKITTQKQLDEELARMRRQYEPFMRNLAPQLPETRKQTELDDFEWRLFSSDMREDEEGNMYPIDKMETVNTSWQVVSIPHYVGPINHAEAVYRKKLNISDRQLSFGHIYLHFNAVDYRSEIYINHKLVGKHVGLLGAFEWDIKPFLCKGENLLEVKVINEPIMMGDNNFLGPKRKFGKKLAACGGPGWNGPGRAKGWQNCPPGFGIWQRCYIESRSDAFIDGIYVRPNLEKATAEVEVELAGDIADSMTLYYSLYGQNFREVVIQNMKVKKMKLTEDKNKDTKICKFTIAIPEDKMKIWSLDEPWLYQLQVKLESEGELQDARKQTFGMRSFIESKTSTPKGRFYLNGREIKLRGANMMGNLMQCVMRKDFDQLRDDILLAKIAGMTFWRMTQQPCQEEVFDYFDQLGMLSQCDMPCFNGYRKDCVGEVLPQFEELIRLVRNHPCNALVSYCNEPDFSKPMMLNREEHVSLFSAFDEIAERMNPGQVTKWIEGDYISVSQKHSDHHCYDTWYGDNMRNVYFGGWYNTVSGWMASCGEFGAEGLDDGKLMTNYYPLSWQTVAEDGTWSPNQIPLCQTERVGKKWLRLTTCSKEDWIKNSREYQMWTTRLFTEALRRNPKINAFSIHLLIDAWPAGWLKSIMDTDRKAKPAYFAYKDALSPVAVNLRPDTFYGFSGEKGKVAVFICNDTSEKLTGHKLCYQILSGEKVLYTGHSAAIVPASEPQFQGYLEFAFPEVKDRTKITVQVALIDEESGALIHDSSYELEVLPAAYKNKEVDWPGGYPQRLIQ